MAVTVVALTTVLSIPAGYAFGTMRFPLADLLFYEDLHDVILVGYRGVDGSSVLSCPEVTAALASSADFLTSASIRASTQAFAAYAHRLQS